MTAYRHVRSGKLGAERVDGRWIVSEESLEYFRNPPEVTVSGAQASSSDFRGVLLSGDDIEAWRMAQDELIRTGSLISVYSKLVVPAMQVIGELWAAGQLAVVDEHRATVTVQRVIARLSADQRHRGRKRGTIVIGSVETDTHSLPTSILADVARMSRLEAWDLGANTPAESFRHAVESADRVRAAAVSVSTYNLDDVTTKTVSAIRQANSEIPVFVGGAGIRDVDHAERLGADATASSIEELTELFEAL